MSVPKWRISVDEIPEKMAIHRYLLLKTDLKDQMAKFAGAYNGSFAQVPLLADIRKLCSDVERGIGKFGIASFQFGPEGERKNASYLSASLTFNPDSIDRHSEDPHRATLGSTLFRYGSYADYENDDAALRRNTYNDTYSFKHFTPFANEASVGSLLRTFSRTVIRSRISVIPAQSADSTKLDYAWHNDEPVFINLRVNIPIVTSENYAIQIVNEPITEFSMEQGFAYAYDTYRFHRPYCRRLCDRERIHMIVGVSPWFDFIPDDGVWVSNAFYGEMHPFEMLKKGHISNAMVEAK